LLSKKSRTSRELVQLVDGAETHILRTIQLMLEAGQIKINTKNEYERS